MVHILINPSLGAASLSRFFFNPAIFAKVIAILELARSFAMGISNTILYFKKK